MTNVSDWLIGLIAEADWPAAPGSDSRIREAAPEGRSEAEGPRAAAEGLQHREERRGEPPRVVLQHGERPSLNSGRNPARE